jgi:hypothetical protein
VAHRGRLRPQAARLAEAFLTLRANVVEGRATGLAARLAPGFAAALMGVVAHDAHAAIRGEHLEPVDLAAIALHRFGAQHLAPGLAFGAQHRFRQFRTLAALRAGPRVALLREALAREAGDGGGEGEGAEHRHGRRIAGVARGWPAMAKSGSAGVNSLLTRAGGVALPFSGTDGSREVRCGRRFQQASLPAACGPSLGCLPRADGGRGRGAPRLKQDSREKDAAGGRRTG